MLQRLIFWEPCNKIAEMDGRTNERANEQANGLKWTDRRTIRNEHANEPANGLKLPAERTNMPTNRQAD